MSGNQEDVIKPDVLSVDDIVGMVPRLAPHRRMVERVMHWLKLDEVNGIHRRHCHTPGPAFSMGLLGELDRKMVVDGTDVLEHLPEGAFVTVSNHPFGAVDGIALIGLIGSLRPDFKVMVNMILNRIGALRPNFIAVDALSSDDPEKRKVSVNGIRETIKHARAGHPVGFFPAGAVSKVNGRLQLEDRDWQPSVIRIIRQLRVPVIPIYFHGSNSWWFNFLGKVSWQLRTLRLPAEVFNKNHRPIYISVGDPIPPETIAGFGDDDVALGKYLKQQTYALRDRSKK